VSEPQSINPAAQWTLVGYGFGGRAIVAELGLAGIPVTVLDRDPDRLRDLHRLGGLNVRGRADDLVEVTAATTDPLEALPDADVILVCTWSYDHDSVARTIAPHLRDDQLIVLVQGHFGGALEVRRVLTELGAAARVTIAEMDHFPFFGHLEEGGAVVVLDDPRSRVNIGAIPASKVEEVLERVSVAFPMARSVPSLLNTGFADTSALLHIPGLLFNVGLVEGPSEYRYYLDTMHPSVVAFVERADAERIGLAEAFSVEVPSLETWYRDVHGLDMPSLRDMLHHMGSWTYRSAPAPKTFDCPYVNQDLAFTLVGWSTLAQAIDHPVPLIDAMIDIVGSFTGRDYRAEYGGLARLGVEPGTASEVRAAFEGERT
jgi:opine dehydrogenase